MLSGLAGLVVGLYVMHSVAAKLPVVGSDHGVPRPCGTRSVRKLNDYQHLVGMIS